MPCVVIGAGNDFQLREGGVLSDLVPTMFELMGIPQPKEMSGKSLIVHA